MLEFVYYVLVAVAVLLACVNWRCAFYACVLLDIIRDPVRKLTEGHPVFITVSIGIVWLAITVNVFLQDERKTKLFAVRHPRLRIALMYLCLSLLPGAIVSIAGYESGWRIALLGAASYFAAIPGVLIGYAFARNQGTVYRMMLFFCIAHSFALTGTIFEYLKLDVPALGGIDIKWIRHIPGYVVELISGFYRSPDVLGWHAAMVCILACVLAMQRGRISKPFCNTLAIWAATSLLLCGRRKMINMPFIFAAAVVYLNIRYAGRERRRLVNLIVTQGGILAVFVFASTLGINATYIEYASTILTEGGHRSEEIVAGSLQSTFAQSGFLGRGLGTATQGNYHMTGSSGMSWQEDGSGRLLAELGIAGVFLLAIAVLYVFRECRTAFFAVPPDSPAFQLQCGLVGILLANLACFLISHQTFSGDPASVCFTTAFLGMLLALPENQDCQENSRKAVLAGRIDEPWSPS